MLDYEGSTNSTTLPSPPKSDAESLTPINFNNPTYGPLFHQLYFRQAFQHVVDQAGWIHAYLHRVEGDLANARGWYSRAGRPPATCALAEEWSALASEFL